MKEKALTQKNTLLKNAQANAEGNFFKRVFFSPPQEEFFPPFLFLIKLFFPTHGFTADTTSCASNIARFGQGMSKLDTSPLRTDRSASANNGFAIAGVPWLIEHWLSSAALVDSLCFVFATFTTPFFFVGNHA